VSGAHGIILRTDRAIAGIAADEIDMIVLPGGWGGTDILAEDAAVQSLLKAMDARGKQIGAMCAAPYALHKAGVLKPNYTCYPSVEEQIGLEGYRGDRAQVVEEGNVMTSRGPGTAICFGLRIVKKLCGDETFGQLREGLLASDCEA
jgi:4-methyl-5(b-hydroxyethyl)-thiazole monophosphate biosynthesis